MTETTKKRFVCGGQDFTLKRDPVTGRWDHNRHAMATTYAFQRDGSTANFKIVDIVCEMLNDGITTPERGVRTAKKLLKLWNGERAWFEIEFHEVALGLLKLGAPTNNSYNVSFLQDTLRWISSSTGKDFDLALGQAEKTWLRQAMSACDVLLGEAEEHPHSAEDRLGFKFLSLVNLYAYNMKRAWRDDPTLWQDYLKWAFRVPGQMELVASVLPKLYSIADHLRLLEMSAEELISKDADIGEPGEVLRAAIRSTDQFPYISNLSLRNENIGLRIFYIEKMKRDIEPSGTSMRGMIISELAWELAFKKIKVACKEVGGIVAAGPGLTSLNHLLVKAWHDSAALLGTTTTCAEANSGVSAMIKGIFGHGDYRYRFSTDMAELVDEF